jgi:membrane associated rhomboid family serine protease
MSTSRICPKCEGHFDVANWVCPHCGTEFARPKPMRAGWIQKLAPERGSLTKGLMLVTGIVFLLSFIIDPSSGGNTFRWTLFRMGALNWPRVVEDGEVWRLVTPILLHGSIWHLLFNLVALYQVGPLVEQTFGRARFVVLYFGAGVTGSLASGLVGHGVSVGASGAVCGFIGVMAVWGYRRGGVIGQMVRGVMLRWALFILIFGFLMPRIDNAAHAGGFIGGALMAFVIAPKGLLPETPLRRRLWNLAAAAVLVAVAICVISAALLVGRTPRQIPRTEKEIESISVPTVVEQHEDLA